MPGGLKLMQDFFSSPRNVDSCPLLLLCIERILRQYIQIAIFYSSTRMLKSFLFGLRIYILWSEELPCINYCSSDLFPLTAATITLESFLAREFVALVFSLCEATSVRSSELCWLPQKFNTIFHLFTQFDN